MLKVTIIGVDLAKNVFQLHGATADGKVVFRKKLTRPLFERFMAGHHPCTVAMEASAGAHHWARKFAGYGYQVRLIAPHYVKPFVKRQKNDAADAEAIVEAALRPTMRFVEPKTADQQAQAVAFRMREQLIKQRTESINALRSYLYEFGYIAPEGIAHVPDLVKIVKDKRSDLPDRRFPQYRPAVKRSGSDEGIKVHLRPEGVYPETGHQGSPDRRDLPQGRDLGGDLLRLKEEERWVAAGRDAAAEAARG